MRIRFKWPYQTYSGTMGETTFMSYRNGHLCLGRRWVKPEESINNSRLSKITQNLKSIWKDTSPLFKADVKEYAGLYKKQRLKSGIFPSGAFAVFLRLMYTYRKTNPGQIDLSTLALSDLVAADASVCTIAGSVRAQLLPPVRGWEKLIARI